MPLTGLAWSSAYSDPDGDKDLYSMADSAFLKAVKDFGRRLRAYDEALKKAGAR